MPPNPQTPSLEAIEEKVNSVINAAMSRAISERDRLVQSYQGAIKSADALSERVKGVERRIDDLERNAANVEAGSLQFVAELKEEVGALRSILAKVNDQDAQQFVDLVGKPVRIVGGKQDMVAAGLDDDGLMVCVYERFMEHSYSEIITVAVPPAVLTLVSGKKEVTPAAKTARKAGSAK
ncbi:hypothetical protein IB236_13110 [Acidovorax sp. ACV02]|uniref:hypothetical protein n=1 Tax=Acidovorax sp. ACV02 TaxID=2769310 RepID=UPI00177D23D3|nr:hypothetical protein [Acidovorax sp. ACV02]MBD9406281.1 hypothetical protein [Acidovorax sp. ACV02]